MKNGVTVTSGNSQKVNITAYSFVPELISPIEKSCATNPTLSWQKVKGAESYNVHISENENMAPYISSDRIKDSYLEFKEKKEKTIYYWRVYAQDAQNNFSRYSDTLPPSVFAPRVSRFCYYLNIFPVKISSPSLRGFYRKNVFHRVGSSMTKYLDICGAKLLGLSTSLFNGYDPDHGQELWQTDGSKTNTSLVWDIYPDPESGNPTEFGVMNDIIYFSGCDKKTGCEIRAICSDIIDY